MQLKNYRKIILFICLLPLVLLGACAKYPAKAIGKAEQALLDARKVMAQRCAAEQYNKAENLLALAREKRKNNEYQEANDSANKSRQMADRAIAATVNNSYCQTDSQADKLLTAMRQKIAEDNPDNGQPTMTTDDTAEIIDRASNQLPGGELLPMVQFAFDSASLNDQAKKILQNNASLLKKYRDLQVTIGGHCDNRGSVEYNLALGNRRAKSVAKYLAQLGIAVGRMKTISYGEEKPLRLENNEVAWAINRRAEFYLED